jgi:hypothetical protein
MWREHAQHGFDVYSVSSISKLANTAAFETEFQHHRQLLRHLHLATLAYR